MNKRINVCPACSLYNNGGKSRIAIEHTCSLGIDRKQVKRYKDLIHGFTALGASKNTAWMLIRNKCQELKLQIPTFDKIIEVED